MVSISNYVYEVIKESKFTRICIRFFIFDAIPFSFCSERAYRAPRGTVKNARRAPSKLNFFLVFRSQKMYTLKLVFTFSLLVVDVFLFKYLFFLLKKRFKERDNDFGEKACVKLEVFYKLIKNRTMYYFFVAVI